MQGQTDYDRNKAYQNVIPGTSTSILNAFNAHPNDIHELPVGSGDIGNRSNSFDLRWRVFSSEMEKLKWFYFDHALNCHNNCVNQCSVRVIGVLCVILLS